MDRKLLSLILVLAAGAMCCATTKATTATQSQPELHRAEALDDPKLPFVWGIKVMDLQTGLYGLGAGPVDGWVTGGPLYPREQVVCLAHYFGVETPRELNQQRFRSSYNRDEMGPDEVERLLQSAGCKPPQ